MFCGLYSDTNSHGFCPYVTRTLTCCRSRNKGAVRYRGPSDDGFHVIVKVDGVKVGNGFTNRTLKLPLETPPSYLTNGQWHHFALTISGKTATIVVDGIVTNAMADYSLDLALNAQVYIGLKYTGEMSQVTVWNSSLSVDDIIDSFLNVSFVPKGTLAQGWWSYVFHPGVLRQYSSKLNQRSCETSSCRPEQVDKTPPQAECNRDPYQVTVSSNTDRFVTVEYQKLRSKANFAGYNVTRARYMDNVTSTLPQDATYPLGQYDAIFVAKDESGNYQDCRFPIYVKYNDNCTLPKTDAVLTWYKEKGKNVDSISVASCSNSNEGPTAALPKYIPCGVLGVYDSKNPYQNKVLPSCGNKIKNKYQIDVLMKYQFSKVQCSELYLSSLKENIKQKFKDMKGNGTFPELCDDSNCSNVNVFGNCMAGNAVMAIQIPLNIASLLSGTVTYTLTEVTRIIVLVERKFVFEHIGQSIWLEDTVVISERKICKAGSTFLGGFCVDCGKGMFYNNQTGLCELCSIGTYQQFQGYESCLRCNSSQTTRNIGSMAATDCIPVCPKGQYYKYNTTTLLGSCQKCPRHFYQDEEGQSYCKPCPFQKVTAEEGANSTALCQNDCLSGEEPMTGNEGPCRKCARGTFRTRGEHDNCQSCPTGNTTQGNGSISAADCYIVKCLLGQYWDENNRKCVGCDIGYYQDELLATECKRCPANHITRFLQTNNNTLCEFFCQSGEQVEPQAEKKCQKCRRGYYKNNTDPKIGNFGICQLCPQNYTTDDEGSVGIDMCKVRRCVSGEFISGDMCKPCPLDKYQPMDMPYSYTNCTPCSGTNYGTMNEGSTNITDCKNFCQAGYEYINEICTPCRRRFYKDNSMPAARWGKCVTCSDNNKTTDMEGSKSNNSCVIPICKAGQYVTTAKTCGDCQVDFYQMMNEPNSSVNCTPCPISTGTKFKGSTNQTDCIPVCPGGQQFDNATYKCVPCPMGYYKPAEIRFDGCLKCRDNYTTDGDGQTSNMSCNVRDCPAGTFIKGGDCILCPYAMYQNLSRQNSCISCESNLNTSGLGAVSKNNCTIWCGPGAYGSANCTLCLEGNIKPTAGFGLCEPCDPDKDYTANMNRTVCDVLFCRKGYYKNNTACVPCAAGTYKPDRGNNLTECRKCPEGNTSDEGSVSCPRLYCVPGKTVNMKNQICEQCPKGTWKSEAGNMSCTPCDPSRTTESTGANSTDMCNIEVCGVGQYRNSSKKTGCENCPLNTYQDEMGQIDCKPCGGRNITLAVRSNVSTDCVALCVAGEQYNESTKKCDKCLRGSYKAADGNVQKCTECPSNKTTMTTNSSRLEDCKLDICQPGSYRPEGNTSCSPCPIGQYQPFRDQTNCLTCAAGYITSETNSTSNTSCILNCRTMGGVYYKNGTCVPCPIGEYREPDPDLKMQDGCILCGSGTSTITTGRKSRSDCLPAPTESIKPVVERVSFSFSMTFTSNTLCTTGNKGLIRNQIEIVIYTQMKKKGKGLCKNNCVNIVVTISASSCGSNRRKRQTNDPIIVDVAVNNVSAVLNETDGSQRTAQSILLQTVQDPAAYRVQEGSLILTLETTSVPQTTINCKEGEYQTQDGCVSCPVGTKGESAGSCVSCESGTYQDLTGQTKCTTCVEPKSFTEQNRSTSVSQCKSLCDIQPDYCTYRGICTPSGQSAICSCNSDFTGSRCESRAEPRSNQNAILGGAIGGGVGLLTVILLAVGCYTCLTRRVKKNKSDKRSETSRGDHGEMEFFRNPVYDNGPPSIGPHPARRYPGYDYPAIDYDPYHHQPDMDISAYQERTGIQYEEDTNDQFFWQLAS